MSEGQLLRLFLCTPAVHARSAREAADGMTAYIGSRTQEDLARVESALRAPGTTQRVIDSLVAEADWSQRYETT